MDRHETTGAVRRSVLAGVAAAAFPLIIADASAQDAADVGSSNGDVIVVTAQFKSQDLQDTPIAITAVTGDMLEARGQTGIADVAAQAPNVNLQEAPATFGPAVQAYIRGVGQSDSNFALEPGVGIYVDDVYYSTLQGSMLNLVDLERVEILRGPQGTLAGQNSIGGAVKLYSKLPDGEDEGYLQALYGSYDRTEIRGGGSFTLVPGELFMRLTGAGMSSDGYVDRYDYACTHPGTPVRSFQVGPGCKLGTEGGKSYIAGRGVLRWTPSDPLEVVLIGDITQDESESSPSTLLYVGDLNGPGVDSSPAYDLDGVLLGTASGSPFITYSPYGDFAQDTFTDSPYVSYENYLNYEPRDGTAPYSVPMKNALDSWGFSGQINYELSENLSATSITGYREYDSVFSSAESSPINTSLVTNDVSHKQFSQEVRLSGQVSDIVDFTVGGYFLDAHSEGGSRVQLTTLTFTQTDDVQQQTLAAFFNTEIHVTEALSVIGGVRYSDITKTYVYGRGGVPGNIYGGEAPPALAPLDGLEIEYAGDRLDYRAGLQYRWTDNFMTYAQISTGFKSGGANPRPFFPAQALTHDPETLTAYEAGFKSDFFDRRLVVNAAAFINKYDDILVTVPNCPTVPPRPCSLPLNAGEADVKGFEMEARVSPVEGFSLDASLGYLDFDYKSISELGLSSGITLDMDAPFVQEWQWSIGAQYAHDMGDLGVITPRIDVSYQDSFFSQPINRAPFNEVPERTLVNARIAYHDRDDTWRLAFEVRNLTDKLYYDGLFDNRGSTSSIQGRPAMPRTWAVSLRRNF